MPLPKVVIVGRPNVGKSSLFNWIAGRRIAIVDDVAGVTRDRVTTLVQLNEDDEEPRFAELIDTGGIGIVDRDDLGEDVERQIDIALNEADLVLFVVDIREGRMPLDEEVADRLRYLDKPVILVINKADDPALDPGGQEFYKLGRGKPVYVSTHQNRNKSQLLRLIAEMLPPADAERPAEEVMKIAVVGRPNTGKSTFINTLARAERMIVSERPGTTRDSVDVRFELDGLPFVAIDTAGVRRKAKIRDDLDFYSIHRAERSIRRSDVTLLFLDPTQGISRLDKQLADYIAKQYKPCIFVINKWDLITANPEGSSREAMNKVVVGVQHAFRTMAYMPLAFITAKTGKNVKALLNLAQSLFKQANKRVGTATLNRVVREAVEAHPPAVRQGKVPKILYATQVGTAPPTIVLFVNSPSLFDATYQRYLLNVFREKLPFHDIPIKLYLRTRTQSEGRAPASEDRRGREPAEELDELPSRMDREPALSASDSGLRRLDREVNELLDDLED
ncbi:MAG: ribosome biogenesis GTPase Der [Isosphaeraceae bacterium]|nr:ribosome biogenesis GTPase Der [Isosphaeraceae bacterium]